MPAKLWGLLLVLSGNMLLDALEVSTVVVAMPSIGDGLGLTPAGTSWTMTGFALGFGGCILLAGKLVARFDRRVLYLSALLVFAVASIVCGLAADGPTLVAARVVKGICVALTVPTGLAIIATSFPDGAARSRALSVYTLCGASGFSVGLVLSGVLTDVSWRWTLLFSGIVSVVLLLLATRLIPGDGTRKTAPARAGIPISSGLLRSAAGAAAMNGTYWGFLLLSTFEAQRELGASPLATALVLLPASVPLTVTAMYSGRLIGRFGPERLILAGSLSAFLGYAWSLIQGAPAGLLGVVPTASLVGIGFMLSFAAFHFQAVTGVPADRQGVVSGVYQTSVQIGGVLMLGLVAHATGLAHRPALLLITAVAAAGAGVAVAGLVTRRRQALGGDPCPPTRSESLSS